MDQANQVAENCRFELLQLAVAGKHKVAFEMFGLLLALAELRQLLAKSEVDQCEFDFSFLCLPRTNVVWL